MGFPFPHIRRSLVLALAWPVPLFAQSASHDQARARGAGRGPDHVDITWMSISNMYYELGPLRIVTDGYITRLPKSAFSGGGGGYANTSQPFTPDVPAVTRVLNALGGPQQVNLLLTGHSHFDHSFDTGTWATLTGAPIVGSKTTCLQVRAERVPAKRCSVVNGGEKRVLATGVTMYIVRWNHSGDPATNPEQHNAVELADVPHPDPATGGLRAGVAEDFPNGGGNRAFLFVVDGPQGRFSWFFQNSASAVDLTVPIVVDGVNYGAPLANLQRALGQLLHTVRTRPRCTVQKLHSGAHAECVGHSVGSTRTVHGQVATEHKRHLADCEQRRARRTGIQETVIFRMLDCANRRTTGNR